MIWYRVSTVLICCTIIVRGMLGCCWHHAFDYCFENTSTAHVPHQTDANHDHQPHSSDDAPTERHHHDECEGRWCDLTVPNVSSLELPPLTCEILPLDGSTIQAEIAAAAAPADFPPLRPSHGAWKSVWQI